MLSLLLLLLASYGATAKLNIGAAMTDITGPAADINFIGYAIASQVGAGIHMRQRARAFVLESNETTPGGNAGVFAFVSADIGMGSHGYRHEFDL